MVMKNCSNVSHKFVFPETSDCSPHVPQPKSKLLRSGSKPTSLSSDKCNSQSFQKQVNKSSNGNQKAKTMTKSGKRPSSEPSSPSEEVSDDDVQITPQENVSSQKRHATKMSSGKDGHANQTPSYLSDTEPQQGSSLNGNGRNIITGSQGKVVLFPYFVQLVSALDLIICTMPILLFLLNGMGTHIQLVSLSN